MQTREPKRTLSFTAPPQRVVCLVPSLTESLFDLGLGASLVGITDYCIYPAAGVAKLPRLGGTKNPDTAKILALRPDLVIANQEENTPETVQTLESNGLKVWVNFPKTLNQSMDVLWLLVAIFQSHSAAQRLDTLQRTLDWVAAGAVEQPTWRYFCPIWQQLETNPAWWMTFNRETYINDLLKLFGGINCFGDRQRRYPLQADLGQGESEPAAGRDTRYPRLELQEIIQANPDVIILPSEPYNFQVSNVAEMAEIFTKTKAAQNGHIFWVDGSLLTWNGTRLGKALNELPQILKIVN